MNVSTSGRKVTIGVMKLSHGAKKMSNDALKKQDLATKMSHLSGRCHIHIVPGWYHMVPEMCCMHNIILFAR